jgi:hypothetical protein
MVNARIGLHSLARVRLVIAVLVALVACPAASAQIDARDTAGSGLDVRSVSFDQQELRLMLKLRTQRSWTAPDLSATRTLCLLISRRSDLSRPATLCAVARGGRLVLRSRAAVVPAAVSGRTLRASVLPSALGLPLGPLWWAVQTNWTDAAACALGCADRVPDRGAFRTSIRALATPPCFGAEARASRCRNRALRRLAYPRPDAAAIWPNAPCTPLRPPGAVFDPCAFGVPAKRSRATVALVGDSHAVHWRAALEVVAQVKRWRGISITRPGCPFSTQVPRSPALGPAACVAQHAATIAWLRGHPKVHTIFVSNWAEPPSGPQGGIGGYGGGAAAYGALLDQLPRSVRHIYVLRDVPGTTLRAIVCVQGLLRHRRPIGSACASPRAAVLTPDPGALAAASRSPRVRVLDLTRFFCGPRRCFPVIGGVYVHKDDNHMNAVFAATLGPYLLKRL